MVLVTGSLTTVVVIKGILTGTKDREWLNLVHSKRQGLSLISKKWSAMSKENWLSLIQRNENGLSLVQRKWSVLNLVQKKE